MKRTKMRRLKEWKRCELLWKAETVANDSGVRCQSNWSLWLRIVALQGS